MDHQGTDLSQPQAKTGKPDTGPDTFSGMTVKPRLLIQLIILVLTGLTGLRFFLFVVLTRADIAHSLSRPAAVEGFLPIGALLSWKRFLLTAEWDMTHPAAMVIFGFVVGVSILLHKSFCSWFCPVGTLSEWAWRLGERLGGHAPAVPGRLDVPLRSIKYILLGFFLWITWRMSAPAITAFIETPYYRISDVKMLYFFTRMSLTTGIVLAVIVIGSVFVKNFWCRYFCPYGALLGLLSIISPIKIRRNETECLNCGKCSRACPHRIDVMKKQIVHTPECSGCMDCVDACPHDPALMFGSGNRSPWRFSPLQVGCTILLLFAAGFLTALQTGHWESQISAEEFRYLLMLVDSGAIHHP